MPTPTGRFNRLPRIAAAMTDRISKVNRVAAFNIQQRAVDSFGGVKTGRRYRVVGYRRGLYHQASAPYEAPAVLFGHLANSIFTAFPDPFVAFVYTPDEKAPYLEFGTIRMEPRPYFAPAAKAEEDGYTRAVEVAIAQAARA